jgi:hypothetical protein
MATTPTGGEAAATAMPQGSGMGINILDLPAETQREIVSHVSPPLAYWTWRWRATALAFFFAHASLMTYPHPHTHLRPVLSWT